MNTIEILVSIVGFVGATSVGILIKVAYNVNDIKVSVGKIQTTQDHHKEVLEDHKDEIRSLKSNQINYKRT